MTSFQHSKVSVLGAAGGIGQPLSLLLKLNPRVTQVRTPELPHKPRLFLTQLQARAIRYQGRSRSVKVPREQGGGK